MVEEAGESRSSAASGSTAAGTSPTTNVLAVVHSTGGPCDESSACSARRRLVVPLSALSRETLGTVEMPVRSSKGERRSPLIGSGWRWRRRVQAMGGDTDPRRGASVRGPLGVSPDTVRSFRWELTPGEDVIDPATFAGSIPQVRGIAPRVRVGRSRWFNLLWLLPIGFVVLLPRRGREGPARRAVRAHFIRRYPGTLAPAHPQPTTGFPAWARWQHFFNRSS